MILAHNALGMVGPSGVMSDDMVALQHRSEFQFLELL